MALKNELTITSLLNRLPRQNSVLYDLLNAMTKEIGGVDGDVTALTKTVGKISGVNSSGTASLFEVMKRISLRI